MPLWLPSGRTIEYGSPVNSTAALNRGLIGWWLALPQRFGGSRFLDLVGRAHGMLVGMGASSATSGWGPTTRPGGFGALRFDGSNDYVDVGHPFPSLGTAYTAAGWYSPSLVNGSGRALLTYRSTTALNPILLSLEEFGGIMYLDIRDDAGTLVEVPSNPTLVARGWYHVVGVRSGNTGLLYLNGQFIGTTSNTLGTITVNSLNIGAEVAGSSARAVLAQGQLDDIRFYNRALSATEVRALYRETRTRYPTLLRRRPWLWPSAMVLSEPVAGAVPAGITIFWPGTHASIPTGWTRETTLDGRFPKGAPASTNPGTTGGAATHSHTTTTHGHTTAHTHTVPDTTGTGGTPSTRDTGTTNPPFTHTHASNPNTVAPTTTLANDTPSTDAVAQDPPRYDVVFLRSNGTTLGFPASSIVLWNDSGAAPTNWNLCDGASGRPDLRGRYAKGAAAAGDGGGTGGGATHSHTIASHTHTTPYAHTHPNVTSSQRSEALSTGSISGAAANVATATHTHALTIGSTSPAITGQTDTAESANHEPPYWLQAYVQNIAGALSWPDRVIALWTGTLASIPANWLLCDGTSGTPDLRDKFIKGATTLAGIGGSGGSLTHGHTATGHTHAVAAHTHTVTGAVGASESRTAGSTNTPPDTHTHTWPDTGSSGFTSGSATPTVASVSDTQPPYLTVVFLQWQAPAPPGGAASLTEEGDTLSSASQLERLATVSVTEASDTLGAAGAVALQALLSVTEANDTLSAAALLAVQGTFSATEPSDTLTSASTLVLQASLSVAEPADTLASAAQLALHASASLVDTSDTLTSAAILPLQASAALTEPSDTVSSLGLHAIVATLSVSEEGDTLVSTSGALVQGDLSVTEAADTLSSASTLALQGTVSLSESADAVASTAQLTLQASASLVESADSVSSAAGLLVTGSSALLEGSDGLAAAARLAVQATLAVLEDADSVTSAGGLALQASAVLVDVSDLLSSVGFHALIATLNVLEASDTLLSTSGAVVQGNLDMVEASDTLSSSTTLHITGTLAALEDGDTGSAIGALQIQAVVFLSETDDTTSSTATLLVTGVAVLDDEDDTAESTGALALMAQAFLIDDDDVLVSFPFPIPAHIRAVQVQLRPTALGHQVSLYQTGRTQAGMLLQPTATGRTALLE